MAGDVNKIQNAVTGMAYAAKARDVMESSNGPAVTEKAFDDFHLYSLANPVTLRDREPSARYGMIVEGKGSFGFTRGTAQVTLADHQNGTEMTYRAEVQVGGTIAGVGQRLLDSVARRMTKQGLESLNKALAARL